MLGGSEHPLANPSSVTDTNQKHAAGNPLSTLWSSFYVMAALCLGPFAAAAADTDPLHVRIDGILAESHPEGQAPIADDADFLRRAYLALHGLIPTSARARAFFGSRQSIKWL